MGGEIRDIHTLINGRLARALVFITLFVMAFSVMASFMSYRSISMDEDLQGRYSTLAPWDPRIVGLAASMQQAPLCYYLEAVTISILKPSEFSFRINSAILCALACALLFWMLWRFYGLLPAAIGYILLLFNPLFLSFATYGRPNGQAVFFAVLFLFTLHNLIWRRDILNSAIFCVAQVLFFLSIGLHPFVMAAVFIFMIAVVSFYLPKKERRSYARYIIVPFFLSSLIVAPVGIIIINKYSFYMSVSLPKMIARIVTVAKEYTFQKFIMYPGVMDECWPLLMLAVPSAIAALFFLSKESFARSKEKAAKTVLLGAFFLFPVCHWFFLNTVLQWEHSMERYRTIYLSIAVPVAALGLVDFIKIFSNIRYVFVKRIAAVILCLSISLTSIICARSAFQVMTQKTGLDDDWRMAYALMREEGVKEADIIIMEYLFDDEFRPCWFGMTIYFGDLIMKTLLNTIDDPQLARKFIKLSGYDVKNQKMFCFFSASKKFKDLITGKFHNPSYKLLDTGSSIFGYVHTVEGDAPIKDAITFYDEIEKILPDDQSKLRILSFLVNACVADRDLRKAVYYFKKFEKLNPGENYKKYMERFKAVLKLD